MVIASLCLDFCHRAIMWACCAFVLSGTSARDSENDGLGIAVAGLWLWGCASNGMILSLLHWGEWIHHSPQIPLQNLASSSVTFPNSHAFYILCPRLHVVTERPSSAQWELEQWSSQESSLATQPEEGWDLCPRLINRIKVGIELRARPVCF